jgi:magnesium and cobalt transporter
MSDPHPGRPQRGSAKPAAPSTDRRSLFQKLVELVSPGPDSRDELMESLADAEQRELIAPESRMMLEGVIRMADMSAGDVMVAAPHMDLLDIDAPYDDLLHGVIGTGHSRFPVHEGQRDNIIGILMAKDLLKLQRSPDLSLRTLLRPAVEDVLEEIVGEIEDEFDDKDAASDIYTLADGSQRVAGDADITAVNEAFAVNLPHDEFDSIGGLVAQELGRVPRRGETVEVGGLLFSVMLTRGGAVRWFKATRAPEPVPGAETS